MTETISIAKEGEHQARVVHVVRAGKHTPRNDKYQKGSTPRLWITYELLDDKNDQGSNRWQTFAPYGEPINSYFTDKGKQADWLSDIGLKGNDEEVLRSAVGHPVWLELSHTVSKSNGKTYVNIADVSKVRASDAKSFPELSNEGIYFDFYRPVKEDYLALPKWIKDYLKQADDLASSSNDSLFEVWDKEGAAEYKASSAKPAQAERPVKPVKPASKTAVLSEDYDEDIPF